MESTVFRTQQNLRVKLQSASAWAQMNFSPNVYGLDSLQVSFMYLISRSLNSEVILLQNERVPTGRNKVLQGKLITTKFRGENVILFLKIRSLLLTFIGDVPSYFP